MVSANSFQTEARLVVAVDMTPIRPGGVNGGLKPAVFSMLAEAGHQDGASFVYVFLTNSSTHEEVCRLARTQDLVVCVLDLEPNLVGTPNKADLKPAEYKVTLPPPDFLRSIGVDLLYAPFGVVTYATVGIPLVVLVADLLHRDYPCTLNSGQITEREFYVSQTVQHADMIQCISLSGIERMIANYSVPEEKLFYTYLPVQVRLDRAAAQASAAKRWGTAPYFFYPANLWKHKNHETLLVAYRLYRQRVGDAAWDLVLTFHENDRAATIRSAIASLGISDHVHCLGYVSEAELQAVWQGAGALVFPSLHEGFGIPLIEGMHFGVPIATSPDFSLSEVAGDAALFFDPRKPESIASALEKIAGNAGLRETLRCRGKRRLQFFDLATETRKLIAAFKRCAASRNGFPRKPLVLESNAALTLPTPPSDALWTFEIRVSKNYSQNRYRCYLDDASYGSFTSERESVFAFKCRPDGRLLRIIIDKRARCNRPPVESKAIESVVARSAEGEAVSLFELEEGANV